MQKKFFVFCHGMKLFIKTLNFLILIFSDGKEQAMTPFPHWVEGLELAPPPRSLPRLGDPGVKTR
jgi:hypothetical protein